MSVGPAICPEGCASEPTSAEPKSVCKPRPVEGMDCEDMERLASLRCDSAPSCETSSDYNPNETPLMFSRSSSVSSLDSVEQRSIHDDSSVVSEFSQRASGLVSPSELPDSPTLYVRTRTPRETTNLAANNSPTKVHSDVFDDTMMPFVEEGTPAEYSRATSLSALTFDMEPCIVNDMSLLKQVDLCNIESDVDVVKESSDPCLNLSDEEDEDEDMLAACISVGMRGCVESRPSPAQHSSDDVRVGMATKPGDWPDACEDALVAYNTEGTPARMSYAGSRSNLSMLSLSRDGDCEKDSDVSEDCEEMLAECIRSGMPQAKPSLP